MVCTDSDEQSNSCVQMWVNHVNQRNCMNTWSPCAALCHSTESVRSCVPRCFVPQVLSFRAAESRLMLPSCSALKPGHVGTRNTPWTSTQPVIYSMCVRLSVWQVRRARAESTVHCAGRVSCVRLFRRTASVCSVGSDTDAWSQVGTSSVRFEGVRVHPRTHWPAVLSLWCLYFFHPAGCTCTSVSHTQTLQMIPSHNLLCHRVVFHSDNLQLN